MTPDRPPLEASALRALLLAPAGPLARLDVVDATASTNADVVAALRREPGAWPHASLLVADHQTQGRGRAGRTWQTPARAALTCTFVARPRSGPETFGWLPLLAGLGTVHALRATTGVRAVLKWPNDVLVELGPDAEPVEGWGTARKVAGILAEVVPDAGPGPAVAVGVGVNVHQDAAELPVPWATSLALAGARDTDRATVLVALVDALHGLASRWADGGGDALGTGLADEVAAVCSTLGAPVSVALPDGRTLRGTARRLDDDGALVVVDDAGAEHLVHAGDVRNVRA
ncbi:biotin--[acetyl-CoA-carboxylase] ligase [Cellulomonas sp. JZ18]|uniref:biotin--[acetyl-CoA-carboxylase] ligase n=1 Tax=Cellulomonas sp. JZ18 TaxID=2654191 RepID=UPI0012D4BD8E|nr:biotin--[acetyl-CoA-carboxylase] ligase [Cellulomonas sp. JZ18]QGQ20034.1 biotin--[acetyl-CoA-carboxylase] ligase [Cellulomonas sp. JZ18]